MRGRQQGRDSSSRCFPRTIFSLFPELRQAPCGWRLQPPNANMKMLFFSSERAEVESVRQEFVKAGISCEIRDSRAPKNMSTGSSDAELWIQNDQDCHRAFMLCVQLGVGFAKRANALHSIEA